MYKSNKEIEEQFDEKFDASKALDQGVYFISKKDVSTRRKEIKSHISQIRSNDVKSHIEWAEKKKIPKFDSETSRSDVYAQALTDAISYFNSLNQNNL